MVCFMKSFAIVVICYKRLEGIKRLLNCLEKADYDGRSDIDLIFSIDNSGSRNVEDFTQQYEWPHGEKKIRTFSERQGLKKHILQCGDFTTQYDILALFEDDIFVSDSFYHYAYNAAEYYWDDDNIAGISLYNFQKNWLDRVFRFEPQRSRYDSYFLKIAQSWGQVWTKKKWAKFMDWYIENQEFTKVNSIPYSLNMWPDSSWLKYHDRYCIETNRYFVYPYVSLTSNFSDIGQHSQVAVNDHQVELQYGKKEYYFSPNDREAIRYDEYMEREGLGEYLGIDEESLCVDIWGKKDKSLYKRYLLSSETLNFKIIKSFSLSLRPIELSVIQNLSGNDMTLYDTSEKYKNKKKYKNNFKMMQYSIRSHDAKTLLFFSLKLCFIQFIRKIKQFILSKFRN